MTIMAGVQERKIDLKEIIDSYALELFHRKATKKEKKLIEKNYVEVNIDWKRVIMERDAPVYDPEPKEQGSPKVNVLFSTSFANKTENSQRYSFQAHRVTHSSCTVTVEKAVTTGVEMNFKLQTPCQIFEANAGFKREMTFTTNDTETIDEELSWGVDSEVEVKGGYVGEAKLLVLEDKYEGIFQIRTRIGVTARIVYTNRKDNNSFIKSLDAPIVEVVRSYIEKKRSEKTWQPEAIKIDNNRVVCTTTGKCKFKYGVKQVVEVDQKPIDGMYTVKK